MLYFACTAPTPDEIKLVGFNTFLVSLLYSRLTFPPAGQEPLGIESEMRSVIGIEKS
jgi:hypothetical protein